MASTPTLPLIWKFPIQISTSVYITDYFIKGGLKMVFIRKMVILYIFLNIFIVHVSRAQDYGSDNNGEADPPPEAKDCNGIYITYNFMSRTREYPHLKNTTAQPWAFKSMVTIPAGLYELKNWEIFVDFQNKEILVSASNAVTINGADLRLLSERELRFLATLRQIWRFLSILLEIWPKFKPNLNYLAPSLGLSCRDILCPWLSGLKMMDTSVLAWNVEVSNHRF